jgi:acyl carrier protein
MSITDRVYAIFAEELALDAETVTLDLSYNSIPEWDSIAHMHVVMALEEAFGINFTDAEIPELTTVSKVVAAVERRLA